MSQKTNLNVSPYFDDFDPNSNFYRILFKPGYPVQSRELTSLQSILQNQISSFGNHFFKDGSIVIPGNITYNPNYYAVKINPTHVGLSVGLYIEQLVGKKIKGQTSQLTAVVQKVLKNTESETGDYTLYVKYISADANFNTSQFRDSETLIALDNITYGNTTIPTGDTFATAINAESTFTASSVSILDGTYFVRGHFVNISADTLILDQYSNNPSYRVGLFISESIIDAQADGTLYDNARGFSNYAAPGADRLQISAKLTKKRLTDTDDKDFVEILRVNNGIVKKIQDDSTYSQIRDYLAQRTFEESGDYAVDQFDVEVENSLNDRLGSDGVYFSNQVTEQGNVPTEDLLAVKVSPGKAYVRGFDIEKSSSSILDVDKPRTTDSVVSALIPFEMGNKLKVNNVAGTPAIGIDNNFSINLFSQRKANNTSGNGAQVGRARIYSFSLADADEFATANQWDLYLYDVQTFTKLVLSSSVTENGDDAPLNSLVRGSQSGATGIIESKNGSIITVSQTSGNFVPNEEITISNTGIQKADDAFTRSIVEVTVYSAKDIKSVFQAAGGGNSLAIAFSADTIGEPKVLKGFSITDQLSISANTGQTTGVATCAGKNFIGIATDTIISYQNTATTYPQFNRVSGISTNGLVLSLSSTPVAVQGVNNNQVLSGNFTFKAITPNIKNADKGHLYAKVDADNVSNVSFSGSNLLVQRQATGKSTDNNGSLTIDRTDVGITSCFFEPYAADRYGIFYDDGTSANLTSDQVVVSANSLDVTFNGLIPNRNNVLVNAIVKKVGVTNKQKNYIRSEKVEISQSAAGVSTSITGLTFSAFYGTRVEDREISLNMPDVCKVIAIYESLDDASVTLDNLNFSAGLNLNNTAILGEKVIGQSSGAVGQVVTRTSASQVEFVYLNSERFAPNETVAFEDSGIRSAVLSIGKGNYIDKTNDYTLDKGQREQYYDYSRIVRKSDSFIPSGKLMIIFDYYNVPSSDSGDVFSVNSYTEERYESDIPTLKNGIRATDTLDFRPRVAPFTATNASPFAFSSRDFATAGSNPSLVVAPNESSIIGYSYYVPRIDKIVLSKNGQINLIKGVPSLSPVEPGKIDNSMELATLELPAYLYNPDDVSIKLVNNKRYTMRDLRQIEDRLENVEKLTSLTLLELDTKTLQIQDADGLSRFKSGFFVDNFKGTDFIAIENPDANTTVDRKNDVLRSDISFSSLKSQLAPTTTENTDTLDFSSNFTLTDPNVKKTGDLVTLNYSSILWDDIQQSFATKSQKVNPFGVENYNGNVMLRPSSDTWVKTLNVESGIVKTQSDWENTYIGNLLTSSKPSKKLRSRNIEFKASALQPSTNHFGFFGGNSNIDVIPKLIQVTMSSGSFQAGETVYGYNDGVKVAAFRLANANHKSGPYLSPSEVYEKNPYTPALDLATVYSSSTPTINIDTFSLADDSEGRFYGYIFEGMTLVGETSAGQATVNAQSLTTDVVGDLIGCLFIKNPLKSPVPATTFKNGTKTFRLSTSATNSMSTSVKFTEATFHASGVLSSETYSESIVVRKSPQALPLNALRRDPLSQTFRSDNIGGFITEFDLYFGKKDTTEKIFAEIRETDIGGTPKDKLVQDFARIELLPSQITTSTDGSVATKVALPSPLYLQPNKQYALTLHCPTSEEYEVWVGESNQPTVATQSYPDADQVIYSNQYTGGNLFKPQNGSVWEPVISEDLKFRVYRAEFSSTAGVAYFHNPAISIGSTYASIDTNVPKLTNNPVKTLPRKLNIGITTTYALDNILTVGVKVFQSANSGIIEEFGGNINTVGISTVGVGYSNGTYNGVPLYAINSKGTGATANITIANNLVSNVALAATGNGYRNGDLLGITTSNVGGSGRDATISVTAVPNIDTLYLTNVKGESFGIDQDLSYDSGNDTLVAMAGTSVRSSAVANELFTGNVLEVNHYNHGMHSNANTVNISGIQPNTPATKLSAAIVSTNTTISVANTSNFTTFEGSDVTGSNPGYVIVNDEIISYSGVNVGSLVLLTRGENESTIRNHAVGDIVRKYELNGVSLTRINNSHSMPTNQSIVGAREIDRYHIEFVRPANKNTGANLLNFASFGSFGGSDCRATQNIQFNEIIPYFNYINPENTSISAILRTVSGTSAGGNEASFIDQGFEDVSLNQPNRLTTPRLVCSRINETERLSALTRSRSLTLGIKMETTSDRLSPVVDLTEAATFGFVRNRIDKPVSNYATDVRPKQTVDDPHASAYISKVVNLQKPATSLKVLLSAYRNSSSDFRVFYKLIRPDSSEVEQTYELFPGYNNTKDTDGDGIGDTVIDTSLNDGLPDVIVKASSEGEFLEYQFTADNLESFTGFSIKVVMSGTNEAYAPIISDLRAIALA
tara:strand:+ start:108 stop:7211 length:7104 start_codon:yes stop_codon:yes gene_type:complete